MDQRLNLLLNEIQKIKESIAKIENTVRQIENVPHTEFVNLGLLDIWEKATDMIRTELTEVSYNTWISNIKPVAIDDNYFYISVPNAFTQTIVEDRYIELIKTAIKVVTNKEYIIKVSDEEISKNQTKSNDSNEDLIKKDQKNICSNQEDGKAIMNHINFEEMWVDSIQLELLEAQKFWNIRAEEYNVSNQEQKFNLIEYLISKEAINKEYDVLDIGCGTGKHLIELAKISNSVTGIDISPNMISYAKKNSESMNLSNVRFKVIPWQNLNINEFNWNKKFDLVFSNMSPAITSKETLIKMIETSKKYCFMGGFVYRNDKIRDEISRKIMGEKYNKSVQKSIYCAFNILWNMGIYPEITYKDIAWTNSMSNETAIEMYTIMLQKMTKNDNCIKEKIKAYIDKISCDGKVEEVTKAKIAWMLWKVD